MTRQIDGLSCSNLNVQVIKVIVRNLKRTFRVKAKTEIQSKLDSLPINQ